MDSGLAIIAKPCYCRSLLWCNVVGSLKVSFLVGIPSQVHSCGTERVTDAEQTHSSYHITPNAKCKGSQSVVVVTGHTTTAHQPAAGEPQCLPGTGASGSEGILLPSEGSSL